MILLWGTFWPDSCVLNFAAGLQPGKWVCIKTLMVSLTDLVKLPSENSISSISWRLLFCMILFKCLKNAPCLWFGRFSSRVKRCRHWCVQRFKRELECPNQRQGTFLGHLKSSNHPGPKVQSCRSQKVGFSKWCLFFDSMNFRPSPLPSGGF